MPYAPTTLPTNKSQLSAVKSNNREPILFAEMPHLSFSGVHLGDPPATATDTATATGTDTGGFRFSQARVLQPAQFAGEVQSASVHSIPTLVT